MGRIICFIIRFVQTLQSRVIYFTMLFAKLDVTMCSIASRVTSKLLPKYNFTLATMPCVMTDCCTQNAERNNNRQYIRVCFVNHICIQYFRISENRVCKNGLEQRNVTSHFPSKRIMSAGYINNRNEQKPDVNHGRMQ